MHKYFVFIYYIYFFLIMCSYQFVNNTNKIKQNKTKKKNYKLKIFTNKFKRINEKQKN